MNSLTRSRIFFLNLLVILVFSFQLMNSRPAFGVVVEDADVNDYFDFIARVNRYSPLEHAGSHGTLGFGLGVGIAGYDAPRNQEIRKQYWRGENKLISENQEDSERVYVSRVHLHKGLPMSVDIGGAFGQDSASKAQIISGYAQWTMYEGFAMPAFAMRGSMSKIMNLATGEASAFGVEGLASYGFLRFFTVYGSAGFGLHSVSVNTSPNQATTFVLAQDGVVLLQRQYIQRSQSLGLQVQLLPPFCTVAAETNVSASGSRTYMAKLSVGM